MSDALVPVTVVVAVGLTEAGRVLNKKPPSMRPVIGGFLLGIGLYALSGLDESFGRMFCILIIIGALLQNGQAVFKKIGG